MRHRNGLLQGVDQYCLRTGLLVQPVHPIQKAPPGISVPDDAAAVQLLRRQIDLPFGRGEQLPQCPGVTGGFVIIIQAGDKEKRIIVKGGVIHLQLRFDEKAGADPALVLSQAGKEIKAALYLIAVFESFVVGQCLQPQVADPEPAVPLGTILKDRLHTVLHGFQRDPVQRDQLGIGGF